MYTVTLPAGGGNGEANFCSHGLLAVHSLSYMLTLWCPGDFIDYTGSHYLLNTMCDLTQFVVVVPVPGTPSALIAKNFMKDVLLKFGRCLLVVIDDGTPFKATFTAACESLKIPFECVAKRNHKSLLVENFTIFLTKQLP